MSNGHPADVEGECNAWLLLADDYHDNLCTIRCQLPAGHDGAHEETFMRDGPVRIIWYVDEHAKEEEQQRLLEEDKEAERLAEAEQAQDEEKAQ